MSSMVCRLKYLEISFVFRVWIEARNYCFLLFFCFFSDLRRFWWGCANKFLKKKKNSPTFSIFDLSDEKTYDIAPFLRRNKTYTTSLLLSDGKKQLNSFGVFNCALLRKSTWGSLSVVGEFDLKWKRKIKIKIKIKINERMNDTA